MALTWPESPRLIGTNIPGWTVWRKPPAVPSIPARPP